MSETRNRTRGDPAKSFYKKVIIFAVVLCGAILLIGSILNPLVVVGDSMNPTYTNGDVLSCSRNLSGLKTGDVVAFVLPDESSSALVIKRVAGAPGDTVVVTAKTVSVNGVVIQEIPRQDLGDRILSGEYELHEDEYFLLGDNKHNSYDSRYFGPVKTDKIRLKVRRRIIHFKHERKERG